MVIIVVIIIIVQCLVWHGSLTRTHGRAARPAGGGPSDRPPRRVTPAVAAAVATARSGCCCSPVPGQAEKAQELVWRSRAQLSHSRARRPAGRLAAKAQDFESTRAREWRPSPYSRARKSWLEYVCAAPMACCRLLACEPRCTVLLGRMEKNIVRTFNTSIKSSNYVFFHSSQKYSTPRLTGE